MNAAPNFRSDLDYPPFATANVTAFDPESPDAQILSAFERVRRSKVWFYGFDDYPESLGPTADEYKAREDAQYRDEEQIHGNCAATVPGVVAQLLFLISHLDQDRWFDRGLAEHGFRALLPHSKVIDWHARMALDAIESLVRIEWERSLASYERNEAVLGRMLVIEDLVGKEAARQRQSGGVSQFVADLEAATDFLLRENAKHGSDGDPGLRLIKTLAPDQDAYIRKLQIVVDEGLGEQATLWLARDVQHLIGAIEAPTAKGAA